MSPFVQQLLAQATVLAAAAWLVAHFVRRRASRAHLDLGVGGCKGCVSSTAVARPPGRGTRSPSLRVLQ